MVGALPPGNGQPDVCNYSRAHGGLWLRETAILQESGKLKSPFPDSLVAQVQSYGLSANHLYLCKGQIRKKT